jgi:hypothetical protein
VVHPFGLDKNSTEVLPRKLQLDETIKASEVRTYAKYYVEHEIVREVEDSERY